MDESMMKHGMFSWCELMAKDIDAAKNFYSSLFGWKLEEMSMPGMTYTVVKCGDNGIGGMMQTPKGAEQCPPMWTCYVTVDDVDLTAKTAQEMGAKIMVGPQDIPGVGRFCLIRDPQGAMINAITYKR